MPSPTTSHSKTNGLENSGKDRIGKLLITSFIIWKYFSTPSFHWKASLFYQISERWSDLGEPLHKLSIVGANSNESSQFSDILGWGHSIMDLNFSISTFTPSWTMMCPRYKSSVKPNSYFDSLANKDWSCISFNTSSRWCKRSFYVLL